MDTPRLSSAGACRTPDDDHADDVSREKPAATERTEARLTSPLDVDWDAVQTPAGEASTVAAGMSGGGPNGAPMSGLGKAPPAETTSSAPPAPPPPKSVKTDGASTNAARTTERDFGQGPYAAAGLTHDRRNVFAAFAGVKGSTADGIEAEALSVSAQAGRQSEVQATAVRIGITGKHGSASTEAFTATVRMGSENPDGSTGGNVAAVATLVSAEGTLKHSGFSVTGGLSAGIGAEGSIGVRDDDKDGKPEICVRIGWSFVVGGACIELPFVVKP